MKILSKIITSGWLTFIICWASQLHAAQNIMLNWDPNPAPNLAGYRIYYGTSSGVYTQEINVGNTTATLVSNLTEGRTYFFAVTAYNTAAESLPSNEVSYTVPAASAVTASATPTIAPPPVQTARARSKLSNIHDMQVRQKPRGGSVEAAAYARWCRYEP
jgi:fibronectin type III domain protein